MKTAGDKIILSDATGISPSLGEYSEFTDAEGTRIMIPNRLIFRISSCLESDAERQQRSFREWVKSLFA